MSVSQLKRQFEAFSTYLGSDITGHEHLRKLKESFLALRTQLSATTTMKDEAVARLEPVSNRAMTVEQKLVDANAEIHKLQQQLASTTRRLDAMLETAAKTAAEDTEDVAVDDKADFDEATVKSVMKRLRKKQKYCPKCVQHSAKFIISADSLITVLERSSVVNGWSHSDLWTLGAAVSVLLLLRGGRVLVQAPELHKKMAEFKTDPDSDESAVRPLVQWFCKYNVSPDLTTQYAGGMRITTPIDPFYDIPHRP